MHLTVPIRCDYPAIIFNLPYFYFVGLLRLLTIGDHQIPKTDFFPIHPVNNYLDHFAFTTSLSSR